MVQQASSPVSFIMRVGRAARLAAAILTLSAGAALAQEGSRVSGIVSDEQGKGVEGITVRLEPAEGTVASGVRGTSDKKGRFAIANVPSGTYIPRLDGTAWYIKKLDYSARGLDGARLGQYKEDSVPENGVPPISVSGLQRGELNLVIGSVAQAKEAMKTAAVKDATGRLKGLNALFEQQKWEELIPEADNVLAKYPDLGGAVYLKGIAYWKLGKIDDAVATFNLALEKAPDQPGIRGVMGQALLDMGDAKKAAGDRDGAVKAYDEAAQQFIEELKTQPTSIPYQTNLVIAYDKAGKTEDAMREIDKLIAVAPDKPQPYLRLGDMYLEQKKPQQAIETYAKTPGGGDDAATGIYNAAVQLWNQKDLDATLAALDRAIQMSPNLAFLYRLKANCFVGKNKKPEAIQAIKDAIRVAKPGDPETKDDQELLKALGG